MHRRVVVRFLYCVVAFLGFAGVTSAVIKARVGGGYWTRILNRFDLDGNWNIPIWYSSLALMFAAFCIFMVAKATKHRGGRYVRHWYVLAGIFAAMSLDEAVGFHGMLNHPMRQYLLTNGGNITFPWVIPALVFVFIIVAAYLPLVASLPKPVATRILIAGAVFVGGAVGMETASGLVLIYVPDQPWLYVAFAIVEEIMEKIGIVIFIDALLLHLGTLASDFRVRVYTDATVEPDQS